MIVVSIAGGVEEVVVDVRVAAKEQILGETF
jgi:hypothetical protein